MCDIAFQGAETGGLKLEKTQGHVPECHNRDIGRRVHKLISWNGLDLELQPKVTHFREKRVILCHFETSF